MQRRALFMSLMASKFLCTLGPNCKTPKRGVLAGWYRGSWWDQKEWSQRKWLYSAIAISPDFIFFVAFDPLAKYRPQFTSNMIIATSPFNPEEENVLLPVLLLLLIIIIINNNNNIITMVFMSRIWWSQQIWGGCLSGKVHIGIAQSDFITISSKVPKHSCQLAGGEKPPPKASRR